MAIKWTIKGHNGNGRGKPKIIEMAILMAEKLASINGTINGLHPCKRAWKNVFNLIFFQ